MKQVPLLLFVNMFAKMICHPPLGQPTVVSAGQDSVDFIVVLEGDAEKPWQVALWHDLDSDGREWAALEFEEAVGKHEIVSSMLCIQ